MHGIYNVKLLRQKSARSEILPLSGRQAFGPTVQFTFEWVTRCRLKPDMHLFQPDIFTIIASCLIQKCRDQVNVKLSLYVPR